MSARSTQHAFTLIELMVALFITAILFVMGYGAVNQALTHSDSIKAQQERLLAVQTTMRVMAQDFGQAAPRPVREPVGAGWQAAFRSQSAGQGENQMGLVTLTRAGWANPAGIQRPALQRLSYVFQDGVLSRDHWQVLDGTLASQPIRRELLTRVHAVTLRYMDGNREWSDRWPAASLSAGDNTQYPQPEATQRMLPLAVEVTIELEDWGRLVRIFEIPQ